MHANAEIAHQFDDAEQQRHAAKLGMWVFLATEILFFGGMFLGYTAYRVSYPAQFLAASKHTLVLIGSVNTGILLVSSLAMALAVRAAEHRKSLATAGFLSATAALGILFLVFKGFEYYHEIKEGLLPGPGFHIEGADARIGEMFFYIYFLMTGVHALHVTIGIVLIGIFALRTVVTRHPYRFATSVDLLGLYWHFVDIVWVFLFPLLYLGGRAL